MIDWNQLNTQDILVGFTVGLLTGMFVPRLFSSNGEKVKKIGKVMKDYNNLKMVLVVRSDLGMGKGKVAAQCSHATLSAYQKALKLTPELVAAWERTGQTKVVVKLPSDGPWNNDKALYQLKKSANSLNISAAVIHDAGRTQIASGTATVLAVGPAEAKNIDQVTGHLKLM